MDFIQQIYSQACTTVLFTGALLLTSCNFNNWLNRETARSLIEKTPELTTGVTQKFYWGNVNYQGHNPEISIMKAANQLNTEGLIKFKYLGWARFSLKRSWHN